MAKLKKAVVKINFERIPVELAKRIADQERERATAFASCVLCGDPIELEYCKTDEYGKAVHQNCYVSSLKSSTKENIAPEVRDQNADSTALRNVRQN